MPIFIALGTVTTQGMQNLDHLVARHDEAVKRVKVLGGRVLSSYAVMGQYDFIVTLDCPDIETAMRVLSREAGGGNIKYETMPAWRRVTSPAVPPGVGPSRRAYGAAHGATGAEGHETATQEQLGGRRPAPPSRVPVGLP